MTRRHRPGLWLIFVTSLWTYAIFDSLFPRLASADNSARTDSQLVLSEPLTSEPTQTSRSLKLEDNGLEVVPNQESSVDRQNSRERADSRERAGSQGDQDREKNQDDQNSQENQDSRDNADDQDTLIEDPELGILRLIELPVDSIEILDPELGVIRTQELPSPSEESSPSVYLTAFSNFFWTDNVLSVSDDPIDDGIIQAGLSLSAFPALGSRTYLVSSVSGNLVRYTDEVALDYNDIEFNLGVYHAFTRRAYLELGWNNDQFFDRRSGDRFLNDHTFYTAVGRRDRLTSRLTLNTEYELEYNLSDPVSRNRVINQLRASLDYDITPKLETDLSYRLTLVDFTTQNRNDFYHQVTVGLSYDLSRDTQISFFGGGRLGDSSESFLDFNSAIVGVSLSVSVPLF
ncbi:MAG: hypothetical protein VKL39_15280 [Leptolyngbyaceae bacterium]|nr:hypothetical protein [Leptolyngbyaceae bacterium]